MDNKELDELLEKIFSNVNSWLNFAEAKNAANVGFVVACLAAIFSLEDVNALLLNALLYTICIFLNMHFFSYFRYVFVDFFSAEIRK